MSIDAMKRVIDAWDTSVLPKNHDGRLWQMMEEMRQAIAEAEKQDRHELQAKGEHPAPCARHCEANAFKIEIRRLKAQRQPLTDEQLHELWFKQSIDWMEFARAIEAAHGIKGKA